MWIIIGKINTFISLFHSYLKVNFQDIFFFENKNVGKSSNSNTVAKSNGEKRIIHVILAQNNEQ